jgi:hypothetical protein
MAIPDLTDDELERAAIGARVVASQHEEQSKRVSENMREYFREQSRRYRALAERLEQSRTSKRCP